MSYSLELSEKGSGFKILGPAGEPIEAKMLVGLKGDKWFKINSTEVSIFPILGITCGEMRRGGKGDILLYGIISDNSWNWTPGNILYASSIEGELTQTTPSVDEIMPEIGVAFTNRGVIFAPQRFAPKSLLEGIASNPEGGGSKVTNLFVVNNKLKVEYEV